MSKFLTTTVVDQISAASIYVDPAVWSKIIVHKSGKPHWLAILWFSKLLYWYQRTEVRNEVTGAFLGYKKKFKYDKLQRSQAHIAEEMGCTTREAKSIIDALLQAKLITQELRNFPELKLYNLMFIEPIPENILCIMHPKGVHKDTPGTLQRTTPSYVSTYQGGTSERTTYTLTPTLTSSTLTSTYDLKGQPSVDNSSELTTSEPPPKQKDFLKNESSKQEERRQNARNLKKMISSCYTNPKPSKEQTSG